MQALPETKMQSHILSIHSPQSTRKTIMKLKHTSCVMRMTKTLTKILPTRSMLMMIVMMPNQPMHEVGEVPSRHGASVPVTDVAANICFSTLFCVNKKQQQQQTWKVTKTSFSAGRGTINAIIAWVFLCWGISLWQTYFLAIMLFYDLCLDDTAPGLVKGYHWMMTGDPHLT